MRDNGRRLAEVSAMLREAVRPGITALDLDALAAQKIRAMGALPSFKGYVVEKIPFPGTICTSFNEQVVHGIPSNRVVKDGDVLSIDMGLHYGGYHVDHAFSVAVGTVAPRVHDLLDTTRKSLYVGISEARPGRRVGDIGFAIESTVKPKGFGIVQQLVGHGIGRAMHERPSVPNYGKQNTGDVLKPGMCLAIEPMITLGGWKTKILKDAWTVVTTDGSISAHFEHTVAITPTGPEILTVLDAEGSA